MLLPLLALLARPALGEEPAEEPAEELIITRTAAPGTDPSATSGNAY